MAVGGGMWYIKAIIFSLILIFYAGSVASKIRTGIAVGCDSLNKKEIIEFVKRDYLLNQLPRWENEKKELGSSVPVVWVDPQSVSSEKGVWSLRLKARGSEIDRVYEVFLNCKKNSITYVFSIHQYK